MPRFGVWSIPGADGPRPLVLASDPDDEWIEAVVDGRVVATVPKPDADRPAVRSGPARVDGHEVVIYAESSASFIRCDVFVDGVSLTTGEPVDVIDRRKGEAAERELPISRLIRSDRERKGRIRELVFALAFIGPATGIVLGDTRAPLGAVLAVAFILAAGLTLGRGYRFAFDKLLDSGLQQPLVGAMAVAVTVGCAALSLPAFVACVWLAGLG